MLKKDYHVYGISRSETPELLSLKAEFPEHLRTIKYDLSKVRDVKSVIFTEFLPLSVSLHGFINNAAVAYDDIVTNANYDKLKASFDVNFFIPVIITKYAIRNMLFNNVAGSVVHISSISVHTGYKGLSMYAASKGALEAFSKNTSREWGERGIRSNCIVAGFMETEMNSNLTVQQKNRIYNRTALKKPTSSLSVASTIDYLLSDAASSITGQNIFVDSGTI